MSFVRLTLAIALAMFIVQIVTALVYVALRLAIPSL